MKIYIEKNLKIKIDKDILFSEIKKLYNNCPDKMKFAQLYMFKFFYLPTILSKLIKHLWNLAESRSPFLSKLIINYSLEQDSKNFIKFLVKNCFFLAHLKNYSKYNKPKNMVLLLKKKMFILRDQNLIKKYD